VAFKLTEPCTYLAALEQTCIYFDESEIWYGHGTDNSWDEAVALLLWAAGLPVDSDESVLQQVLPSEVIQRFEQAINTRVGERKPAAYITREAWFCGLSFYVDWAWDARIFYFSLFLMIINPGYRKLLRKFWIYVVVPGVSV